MPQCRPASQAVQRTRSRPNDGLRPKVPPAGAGADLKTKGDGACVTAQAREGVGGMFHNTRVLIDYVLLVHLPR